MLACGRHSAAPILATARRAPSASRPALQRAAAPAKAGGDGSTTAAAAGPKLLWLSTSNQVLLRMSWDG